MKHFYSFQNPIFLTLLGISMVGISTKPTFAAVLSVQITADTQDVLTLVGTGNAVTRNLLTQVPGNGNVYTTLSGFWTLQLSVLETNRGNSFNDTLSVDGFVQHIKAPFTHANGVGNPLAFRLAVDADNAIGSPLVVNNSDGVEDDHEIHKDTLTGLLTANVFHTDFSTIDDITSYRFIINVRHCSITNNPRIVAGVSESADSCPIAPPPIPPIDVSFETVPESSSVLSLLAIGALGIGSALKRK